MTKQYEVYKTKESTLKNIQKKIGKLDIQNLIAILISRIQLNQKRGNVKHIYVNNDKK